ncbi:MAG TPA: hypothetical protein EYO88_11190 [Alphaproteobacteria bacterium]|nr:hypothetical protein [Alphaproteobacteria bacterium]
MSVVATGIGVEAYEGDEANLRNGSGHAVVAKTTLAGAAPGNTPQSVPVQSSLPSASPNSRRETKSEQPQSLFEHTATTFTTTQARTPPDFGSADDNAGLSSVGRTEADPFIPTQSAENISISQHANNALATKESDDLLATSTPDVESKRPNMSDRKGLFSRMARSALTRQSSTPMEQNRSTTREPVLETVEVASAPIAMVEADREEDLLEIPAFLRRQAR